MGVAILGTAAETSNTRAQGSLMGTGIVQSILNLSLQATHTFDSGFIDSFHNSIFLLRPA
jgi:hypothetical protein